MLKECIATVAHIVGIHAVITAVRGLEHPWLLDRSDELSNLRRHPA